jgi:hypothetical protein
MFGIMWSYHGFMPITVKAVDVEIYKDWVNENLTAQASMVELPRANNPQTNPNTSSRVPGSRLHGRKGGNAKSSKSKVWIF